MITPLLPRPIDNTYRGHKLAPWLLLLVVSVKFAQSLGILVGGPSVVSGADGIPLDTYTPAAARTVVTLFSLVSVDRLLIGSFCLIVLVRYRSMVPFVLTMLLLQDLGKQLVFGLLPIARVGTPPGPTVNLALLALEIVGLVLSLWTHSQASQTKTHSTTAA